MSLHRWINDGLMAVFFLVIGLEVKREMIQGELSSKTQASLPIAAALGGMLVPALIYWVFNLGGNGARGWGIPMATDIAFVMGVLTLLGKRVPPSLKIFLLALAIVDDLGAVLVIGLFYSSQISWISLGIGLGVLGALGGLNRLGFERPILYLFGGLIIWFAFLHSGIHPTISGVLLAFVLPLQAGQKLERRLQSWGSFGIMPIFALANAGVALDGATLLNPISIGIIMGLVLGKQIGITLFSWMNIRLGWSRLPPNLTWRNLYGASCLGGIGFTMSIFISSLAFGNQAVLSTAKVAVFAASAISAAWGLSLLFFSLPKRRKPLT